MKNQSSVIIPQKINPVNYDFRVPCSHKELQQNCFNDILIKKSYHNNSYYNPALDNHNPIIGINGGLKEVYHKAIKIAQVNENVLITGETGTGKEVIARLIHSLSPRKNQPFIKINCGAIPDTLIESELFGYKKGAFSQAYNDKPGKIEEAQEGTLFLDEIGELKPEMQTRFLQVIQERIFERLGSNKPIQINFRLISATNRDLIDLISNKLFREDLYYRINTFPIHLPALKDRIEDLEPLVLSIIHQFSRQIGRKCPVITQNAMSLLKKYNWPGNIRELENIIKRSMLLQDDNTPKLTEESFKFLLNQISQSSHNSMEMFEKISTEIIRGNYNLKTVENHLLKNILNHYSGSVLKAVKNTGIAKNKFYRYLAKQFTNN